jgi:hypothetical protein
MLLCDYRWPSFSEMIVRGGGGGGGGGGGLVGFALREEIRNSDAK